MHLREYYDFFILVLLIFMTFKREGRRVKVSREVNTLRSRVGHVGLGVIEAWIQFCMGGVSGESLNRMCPSGKYRAQNFCKGTPLIPSES